MFDVETLDTESKAVVLSASIIHFTVGEYVTYEDLLSRGLFIKFNAREQMERYGRTTTKETIDWWSKQHDYVKKTSLAVYDTDMSAIDGINAIKKYMAGYPENNQTIWARGSLDQVVIDSLCRSIREELIAPYNVWRDVRTAVDLLADTSQDGYCTVEHPTFQRHNVIKHHPTHDCALDIMMLLYGK
jgi:hypothetical protein